MDQNKTFYVQYLNNQPVGIKTHVFVQSKGEWIQNIYTIDELIGASCNEPTRRQIGLPEKLGPISIHSTQTDNILKPSTKLSDLSHGLDDDEPLIMTVKCIQANESSDIPKFLNNLKSMVVVNTDPKIGTVFKAQDSMFDVSNLQANPNLAKLQVDCLEGVPELLYSDEILSAMQDTGVELPYIALSKLQRKLKVLIGVSGCGKTRTCFDLGRTRFVIYFDCFADRDIKLLIETLNAIVPSKKTAAVQVEFESVSLKLVQCLFLSRLIVLSQLRDQDSSLTPFDWLCYQRSSRTQQLFKALFFQLSGNSVYTILRVFTYFAGPLLQQQPSPILLIFDESQDLLNHLQSGYHSITSNKNGIRNFEFEHPRSLFSFLARCVVNYESIWCGTQMQIRNMELFSSAAGGKPDVFVLTDFNYLQPTHIAKLLERWLNFDIEDPQLLNDLTGDRLIILREEFNDYKASLIFPEPQHKVFNGSLYDFWENRYRCIIEAFQSCSDFSKQKLIADILLELCVSNLFSDSPVYLEFDPETADMVSTGLVMISKLNNKYRCFMVEPMALSAGVNFFATQNREIIFDYFASHLFTKIDNPLNFTPQQRENFMKLVIALRFLQGWWLEPGFDAYLPSYAQFIPKPIGIIDCRNAKNNDFNYFFQNLQNHQCPLLILPLTNAGPDILYSKMSCYIKTKWTSNSNTSIFVDADECNRNVLTMNPKNWYKSSSLQQQCQTILNNSGNARFIHMRFELPFTAPSQNFNSSKSDSGDTIICVDLNQPIAKDFFGEKFVNQYKAFISSVVKDTAYLKFSN
ncbi:hypothetical protein BC833DRAFT_612966, partial [Globomyces pollinis-pini]